MKIVEKMDPSASSSLARKGSCLKVPSCFFGGCIEKTSQVVLREGPAQIKVIGT